MDSKETAVAWLTLAFVGFVLSVALSWPLSNKPGIHVIQRGDACWAVMPDRGCGEVVLGSVDCGGAHD